jgi:hypothetical protein
MSMLIGYVRSVKPAPIIPKPNIDTGAEAAAKLLDNATDLLTRYGWTRGVEHAQSGEFCSIGALKEASGVRWWSRKHKKEYRRAVRALAREVGPHSGTSGVIWWNDREAHSVYRVQQAMHGAAQKLRAR